MPAPRRPVPVARIVPVLLLAGALAGCGGGSGDVTAAGPTRAPTAADGVTMTVETMGVASAPPESAPSVSATPTTPMTSAPSATSAPPAVSSSPVATSAPAVRALSPVAAAWLDLDLARPAAYASPVLPAHYDAAVAALDATPSDDPVSDRIATLGRVLFHDRRLSTTDAVACASCHRQDRGFDDPARFSTGVRPGETTTAHAMRLGNLRWYAPGSMFWDRRAESAERQATMPLQHPVEMGWDATAGGLPALLAKLRALPYYPELFVDAFGDATISEARIARAIAHFERAMVSTGSAWDTGYARNYDPARPDRGLGTPIAGFTASQQRGRALFIDPPARGGLGCAGCHVPPTFALAANSLSNGLDAGETRRFKSPSLKNVALSSAFMHDGRFASLEAVVEHYDSGVQAGPALDPRLRTGPGGPPRRLDLSAADKAALVAFLGTLTDTAFVADPKFSSPFRR